MKHRISRRKFIKSAGIGVAGLALGPGYIEQCICSNIQKENAAASPVESFRAEV